MMLVILGASLLLFAGSMLWRRQRYLELTEWHAMHEAMYQHEEPRFVFNNQNGPRRVEELVGPNDHELAAFHAGLKDKYQKAADHPWLTVEPDPPTPSTTADP